MHYRLRGKVAHRIVPVANVVGACRLLGWDIALPDAEGAAYSLSGPTGGSKSNGRLGVLRPRCGRGGPPADQANTGLLGRIADTALIANFTLAAVPTAAGQRDRLSWTTPGPWHSLVATVIWPRVGRAAASEDTAWAGVMGLAQPTLPMCGLCNRPPVTGPYEQTDMECRPPTLDRRASWSDQTWKATSSGLQIPASPGGLGGSAG
jgi:hypothetical protein